MSKEPISEQECIFRLIQPMFDENGFGYKSANTSFWTAWDEVLVGMGKSGSEAASELGADPMFVLHMMGNCDLLPENVLVAVSEDGSDEKTVVFMNPRPTPTTDLISTHNPESDGMGI